MRVQLGKTYRDVITNFTGVCTARIEYLTGCNQGALQSRSLDKEGKPQDSVWFDEQKLLEVEGVATIELDNDPSPGADFSPPSVRG